LILLSNQRGIMDKKQEALIKAKRYIRRPAKLYKRYKTKVKEILNGGDAI